MSLDPTPEELRAAIDKGLDARLGAVGTARYLVEFGERRLFQEIRLMVEALLIEHGSKEDHAKWKEIIQKLGGE